MERIGNPLLIAPIFAVNKGKVTAKGRRWEDLGEDPECVNSDIKMN